MFIARLHSDYRLPYKAIAKGLYDLKFISNSQYENLYRENNRDTNEPYHRN